ncbi:MAG: putative toxin-antitoxin system toxin component, PIN family [Mariprofundales bacterium]|nr:putative toxin-antitoxin system toxin component, PIN family [Mariprofundales bacterium]
MRLVVDTNVLVSGLLTPFGVCGDTVRLITSGAITLCVDGRILFKYEEVLQRPRFRFAPTEIGILMAYLNTSSEFHGATPLLQALPDSDDAPFLEVAIAAHAEALVTGNAKHFPPQYCRNIPILSPRALMDRWRKTKETDHVH